ncbi:MAG: MFS transporter [Chloroflexi bacterium]|nr:MFS transporter [Chloroflexota bacterium]
MKPKVFYGWYIAVAGLVLAAYYGWIFSYGWTVFVNPILITFGWSMTQLSLASSLRSLETGVFNPLWGKAVDRWSSQKLMLFGVVSTAFGMFFLSQTKNLAMYYLGFLIVGLGSSLITSVLPMTVISRWFKKDLGKAVGLFYTGVGIGGAMVPLLVKLIDILSWQTTLLYASIGLLVLGIPLSFVFRTRPADYGLVPDGKAPNAVKGQPRAQASDFGTDVKEALKTRAFWYIGMVNLAHTLGISTLQLYAVPYLTNFGVSRTTAGTLVGLYTLVSVFGRMPMGILSDVFRKSYVIALSVTLQGVGFFIFWLIGGTSPPWLIPLFAITFGLGLSGAAALRAPILREYFGTNNFGTIFGLSSVFLTVGSMAGPVIAGWLYDKYQDYKAWWMAVIALTVLALIMILTIPIAKKRNEG